MPSRRTRAIWIVAACMISAAPFVGQVPPPATGSTEVAPGLAHRELRRGEVTDRWRFRVVVGRFGVGSQPEADALVSRLEAAGRNPGVRYEDDAYVVSVGPVPSRREARELADRLAEQGFPRPLPVEIYGQDLTNPEGPWEIHVLEVDLRRIRAEIALAQDETVGLETTRSLAARRDALAAVNGGFFRMTGLTRGDPTGLSVWNERLVSETDRGRAAVGFLDGDAVQSLVFGRPSFRGRILAAHGGEIELDGLNRERDPGEVVLYTPDFHRTTLTEPGGIELVVENGRIRELLDGAGSTPIPAGGFVVSAGPEARSLVAGWSRGDRVSLDLSLVDPLSEPGAWDRVRFATSAGPLILRGGEARTDWAEESISRVFGLARHPRTALGVRADGTLLLVTVDGRESRRSVGMTLPELTDLVRELGAVTAINLDGGGSTTMVVEDEVVNRPSGGERWNGDALLLFPR